LNASKTDYHTEVPYAARSVDPTAYKNVKVDKKREVENVSEPHRFFLAIHLDPVWTVEQ
jgi:hypothetical protein